MDIKCIKNPYNFLSTSSKRKTCFQGGAGYVKSTKHCYEGVRKRIERIENVNLCENIVNKRPIVNQSAVGLLNVYTKFFDKVKNYFHNIKHTIDHKIVFALIEKELFGKISKDSLTHDLDKLVMYIMGFSHSFVSKFHRKISEHHTESGKKSNLKSMLCDNIASSPEFKPEKKKTLREYYNSSPELQSILGFKEILEKYNYGEDIDFNLIKTKQAKINHIPKKVLSATKTFCSYIVW